MKKLIWILLLMFIVGCVTSCAKTMAHREYFDAVTGNKIAVEDLTMSRPIFAAMGAGSTSPLTGAITMNSASSISVEQMMGMAIQGYQEYISGGLANKTLNMQQQTIPSKTETTKTETTTSTPVPVTVTPGVVK